MAGSNNGNAGLSFLFMLGIAGLVVYDQYTPSEDRDSLANVVAVAGALMIVSAVFMAFGMAGLESEPKNGKSISLLTIGIILAIVFSSLVISQDDVIHFDYSKHPDTTMPIFVMICVYVVISMTLLCTIGLFVGITIILGIGMCITGGSQSVINRLRGHSPEEHNIQNL